jgi:hypothetical protein
MKCGHGGDLHEFIVETQNQLAFFDIMVHLMIHLVHQIEALGPSFLHEMWSYEWFMSVLNRYVHNRTHPEGSMIEGYNFEVVECCQEWLKVQRRIGNPDSRHKRRLARKGTSGRKVFLDNDYREVSRAHYSVLQSMAVMQPYIDEHMAIIMAERNGRSDDGGHETAQATPDIMVEGLEHIAWRNLIFYYHQSVGG